MPTRLIDPDKVELLLVVPTVTLFSVPEELVNMPVLVSVPFLMVPVLLSVVAPVSAIAPPALSIVPAMVLPPAPFRFTLVLLPLIVMAAPDTTARLPATVVSVTSALREIPVVAMTVSTASALASV